MSNMRYSLLASKDQWQEWQEKLGKFWVYCDKASKAPVPQPPSLSIPHHPTLPTTPVSMQASPPSLANPYPASSSPFTYSQPYATNTYATPHVSPLPTMPDLDLWPTARKRSFDGDEDEPALKRVTRPFTAVTTGPAPFSSSIPAIRHDAPRLPVPHLTISTSQSTYNGQNVASSFPQNIPLLPPLGGRAMSTVFPSTPSYTPQLPMLTPNGSSSQHGSQNASGYGTPTRRQSPHSVHDLLSLGSSPVSANFPGHNPGYISPSIFLQQRNSPYKPVRHVNTLLYPPPSASLHGYAANVSQMHYQPLGRRNDYRSGVVPDYASHSGYQHWPVLPQPNFHTSTPSISSQHSS